MTVKRRKRNEVNKITSEQGTEETTRDGIGRVLINYFKDLFNTSNPNLQEIDNIMEGVPRLISDEDNEKLKKGCQTLRFGRS